MKYKKDVIYRLTFRRTQHTEYYRQLKSIYAYHNRDEIGCLVGNLYDFKIEYDKPFTNKRVKIELVEIR